MSPIFICSFVNHKYFDKLTFTKVALATLVISAANSDARFDICRY